MLHYEIHVTVRTNEVERFQEVCKAMGVKPIILELQKKSGDVLCEVMTSSTISTDDPTIGEAKVAMIRTCSNLSKERFVVVRAKIETVPWHPLAPSEHNGKFHYDGSHFETHFGVIVKNIDDFENLKKLAKRHSLHLSRNTFKQLADGSYIQMATRRSYTLLKEDFELLVDTISSELAMMGLTTEKPPVIEFAILDTDQSHDDQWLKS